jgi:hypothetical protein
MIKLVKIIHLKSVRTVNNKNKLKKLTNKIKLLFSNKKEKKYVKQGWQDNKKTNLSKTMLISNSKKKF